MSTKLSIFLIVIVLFIISGLISLHKYKKEKQWYNNGKCTKCGSELNLTTTTPHGTEVVCNNCHDIRLLKYYGP